MCIYFINRYDGGQLMILRGVNNLKKCAWIGETDSSEEIVDIAIDNLPLDDKNSTDKNNGKQNNTNTVKLNENESVATDEELDPQDRITVTPHKSNIINNVASDILNTKSSKERQMQLDKLIKQAILLSKSKTELLKSVHKQGKGPYYSQEDLVEITPKFIRSRTSKQDLLKTTNDLDSDIFSQTTLPSNQPTESVSGAIRNNFEINTNAVLKEIQNNIRDKRSVDYEDFVGGMEELDDEEDEDPIIKMPINLPVPDNENMTAENQIGEWMIPKGLKYDQGIFNQTNDADTSFEEYRSSFSSSEEALASCKGVILSLPLVSSSKCLNYDNLEANKISYQIPITGTYYFVFSSDNEVFVNDLYFNLTMQRVVYETEDAHDVCLNSTDCSLPIQFLSKEQMIVEALKDNNWTSAYTLHTACEPRVTIYLILILLVPILILFCALR